MFSKVEMESGAWKYSPMYIAVRIRTVLSSIFSCRSQDIWWSVVLFGVARDLTLCPNERHAIPTFEGE